MKRCVINVSNNISKLNQHSLEGEYYTAFSEINKRLSSDLVPKSFRLDVTSDIMDIFIRNQNEGKKLSEVIGTDIKTFISEILEAYFSTISTKTLIKFSIQNGFLFGGIFGLLSLLDFSPSLGTLLTSLTAFILGISGFLINYKICLKFSRIPFSWLGALGGLLGVGMFYVIEYISKSDICSSLNNPVIVISILLLQLLIYFLLQRESKLKRKKA